MTNDHLALIHPHPRDALAAVVTHDVLATGGEIIIPLSLAKESGLLDRRTRRQENVCRADCGKYHNNEQGAFHDRSSLYRSPSRRAIKQQIKTTP